MSWQLPTGAHLLLTAALLLELAALVLLLAALSSKSADKSHSKFRSDSSRLVCLLMLILAC